MIEQFVSLNYNGQNLRGMLHRPDSFFKGPIAIIYHGFTGSRVDNKFLFTSLSRELSRNNIGSIRFDFLGSGESDGEFKDMTLSSEISQGKHILEYTLNIDWVSEIYLIGFSMGGIIAAHVAKLYPEKIKKLVLWSPAGNIKDIAYECFQKHRKLANGNVDLEGLELGKAFYEELLEWDVYQDINTYKNKVLVIHGTNDLAVPIEYGKRFKEIYSLAEFKQINGADHCYTSLSYRKQLFDLTVSFLKD